MSTSIQLPNFQQNNDPPQSSNNQKPNLEASPPLDYKKYEDRLRSYKNWPNKEVPKEKLAEAGFYYKNHSDVVQCPFCHIEGYQWVAGDNPMTDHISWSPNCSFVMTSVEHDNSSNNTGNTIDTCGLYGIEILPNSVPEGERQLNLEKLGIQKNKGPAHPEKITYELRLETFSTWPKSLKQTPHALADAGFFYLGVGDQTLCFHCGGGLKDWEENDDPWEEHALWFPQCQYLFLKKGRDYIDQIRGKGNPPVNSIVQTGPETKENAETKMSEIASESEAESKTLCKICYKNELGVVFLPCGHIVACVDCAAALKTCAICRKPLEATVRAFLS